MEDEVLILGRSAAAKLQWEQKKVLDLDEYTKILKLHVEWS